MLLSNIIFKYVEKFNFGCYKINIDNYKQQKGNKMTEDQITGLKLLKGASNLHNTDLAKIANRTPYLVSLWLHGKRDMSCNDLMKIVSYAKENKIEHFIINKLLGGFCDQI